MRNAILLAMTLPMVLVGAALACNVSDAHFSGQFDDAGRFVLQGAMNSSGQPIEGAGGMVLTSVTAADGVTLPASGMVWAKGDLDLDKGSALVKGFTASADEAAAVVASLQGATYTAAGSGSGCSSAKAASAGCSGKASAATASASGCSSKASAATASASGCSSKASAATASASGCSSKAASAKTASAQTAGADGCCPGGAAASTKAASTAATASTAAVAGAGAIAVTAGSEGCGADCAKPCCAAAASAETAETACKEGCVKPCCAANTYTYTVANMTCGACTSKVEGAVKAMENSKIAGCWVDLDKGTAVVTSSEELDGAAIAAAITTAGFPAEQVVEKDKSAESDVDESAATM